MAKNPALKQSAPVQLTEEEVRSAREGKGTHKLPERGNGDNEYSPVKPGRSKKPKS